jgi:hypothetical protein
MDSVRDVKTPCPTPAQTFLFFIFSHAEFASVSGAVHCKFKYQENK